MGYPAIEKILVIDDEKGILDSLRRFLIMRHYRCMTASSAEEALEIIKANAFDAVIADISMPGMDGLELMRRVKAEYEKIEFIIMTGHAAKYPYGDIIDAGAADFLRKPFEEGELQAKLDRIRREREMVFGLSSAAEDLSRQLHIHASISTICRALITSMPLSDISALVLDCAMELTESKAGYSGFIDTATGRFVCPRLVVPGHLGVQADMFREDRSEWRQGLLENSSVMTNAPAGESKVMAVLAESLPITRFLSVPALVGDRQLGQITLANAARDYRQGDMGLLKDLAAIYAVAIERTWKELELKEANQRLQELLEERTRKFNAAGELLKRSIAVVKDATREE